MYVRADILIRTNRPVDSVLSQLEDSKELIGVVPDAHNQVFDR
jgi:hypothetical protein